MKAFVTGSQVYGTPTVRSDIDLVVMVSPDDLKLLKDKAGLQATGDSDPGPEDIGGLSASLKFGKLNLICVTSQKAFNVWKQGTEDLEKRAPVTRDEAVEHFKKLRIEAGLIKEKVET